MLPFKPNLYETKDEVQLFWLQITRIIVTLLIVFCEFYLMIHEHLKNKMSLSYQKLSITIHLAFVFIILIQLRLIITMSKVSTAKILG